MICDESPEEGARRRRHEPLVALLPVALGPLTELVCDLVRDRSTRRDPQREKDTTR